MNVIKLKDINQFKIINCKFNDSLSINKAFDKEASEILDLEVKRGNNSDKESERKKLT